MEQVRVRFAPSPTGYVHVGSLRTALYNYLFARHNQGKLILRIEDTDQKRYVKGSVENLLQTLDWAGLEYDEGPQKGGPYGPYKQSERLEIYQQHIETLLDKELAYPCFCTEDRLNDMREKQAANNEDIKYDGLCRGILPEEVRHKIRTEPYVIRMKVPIQGETVINDSIRGKVTFNNELIDDQVLLKSDGYPTYHLANVVDDHLMQITHVIRGEEWLPSTPKHTMLYQAFGWEAPQFAHLPLLLNPDRSKLSKRQGDVAVEDYRSKGILAEALNNFVALLGWNSGYDREIFSLAELTEIFSLERVNKAGAVFDLTKLNWMNGHYIRTINDEDYYTTGLFWMAKLGLDAGSFEKNKLILAAVRDHINTFSDLQEKSALFFTEKLSYSVEALTWIKKSESIAVFNEIYSRINTFDELTTDNFKLLMKDVQKETAVKGKDLWMPVRAAITGLTAGPEMPAVLQVLGKEKIKTFLKQAISQG